MKTIKNILIISMMGICLDACNSDDTESESTDNKISAPTVNGKRLVKIKCGETFTSLEYNSQGQVSKVKYHSKDGTTREESYWYEDRRVIWSPYELIYNLSDGHAVECNFTALTSDDENAMTVECRDTYAYDSGGHLIKVTRPYDFSEGEPINEIYTNLWSDDGNISSVIEKESSEVGALFEYEIKYSSIENNIPLFFTYYNKDNIYLEWQGCFGKRCKNLPQSVICTNRTMEPSWEGYSITYNYDYTSENGLITKISVVSTTNKRTSSKDVYELEWW